MIFEVNRTDFRDTRVIDPASAALQAGEIRLSIERAAFTSNNITYAMAGDMLAYWGFFPADDGWGRIPTMGLATVAESANPDIATGGRYFGFYPMATELVIEAQASRSGFTDVGAHRAAHAAAYTGFLDVTSEDGFTDELADNYLLLRGLFATSYLIDDYLDDNNFQGAVQTLVTSASSKTSIALAHCLHQRGHHSVGLTSAGNRAFVEGLGLYSQVITYDEIDQLDAATVSGVVDMAGNAGVQATIHRHFDENLVFAVQVGKTHWEDDGANADLPGATPEFFFAPGQMAKRDGEWGPGELAKRLGGALSGFLEDSRRWLSVEHSTGADGIGEVYHAMLEGRADPSTGHIIAFNDIG